MAAYWVGRTKIIDPRPFEEYKRLNSVAAQKYPYKILARGGRFEILEGNQYFSRFVIHEFPHIEAALELYHSTEYQRAIKYRHEATDGRADIIITEGIETL